MSLFSDVPMAPPDPILGITEQFRADTSPNKVNLGVGVYYDADGRLPLLRSVEEAEKRLAAQARPKGYLPIDGLPAYIGHVQKLVFGAEAAVLDEDRVVTAQALGGTGALRVGADLLRQVSPEATVLISSPSWENHRALFTRAGFVVESYRYYAAGRTGVDIEGMIADLRGAVPGTIVVLHACCHNPTGSDLSAAEWGRVIEVVKEQGLIAVLDMAYQGFSQGPEPDAAVVRRFAAEVPSFLVANSFSKNFSLYGERSGALSLVCVDADEAARVRSQMKIVIRTNYSNPTIHGASLVATVLGDEDLREQWLQELAEMRDRIKAMRSRLVRGLQDAGVTTDMSHLATQVGMFSFSGLSRDQMVRLRAEFGVYGTDSGRLNMAALNEGNVDHVSTAIAGVVGA
ncbi:MAG: aromatic amino acid transaminase [Propioniciclava sp.]